MVRLALAIFLVSRFGLIGGALAAVVSVLIEEAGLLLATFRRFKLRAVDLLASNWRCGLASVAMAAAVLVVQSWQGTLRGGVPAGAGGLAVDVLAGAVSYTIALLAAWLAVGQPPGAETYVRDVMRQALRGLRARRSVIR